MDHPAPRTIAWTTLKPKSARPLFTLLLAVLVAGRASAQAAPSPPRAEADITVYRGAPLRLVVDKFEGPGAEMLRTALVQALEGEPSVDVVPVRYYQQAARALDGTPRGYAEVAKRLTLAAILRGRTAQDADGYNVTVSVIDGASGEIVSRLRFPGKRLASIRPKIRSQLWPFLGPILRPEPESPAPTPPTGPEPPAWAPPPAEAWPATRPAAPEVPFFPRPTFTAEALPTPGPAPPVRCPWLTAALAGGVTRRLFGYQNERRGALRSYTLVRSPLVGAEAAVFPFTHGGCRATGGPGFGLAYEQIVGARSELGGRTLSTSAFALQADLLWRFRVSRVSITPRAGYRLRRFQVEDDVVPDVAYHAARLALELGLDAGPVFAEVTGSGSLVLAAGELDASDWFPRTTGASLGLDARLGVPLFTSMSILVGGQLEMYALRFNVPQDSTPRPRIADGAVDRYFAASLSARIELPWKGPRR